MDSDEHTADIARSLHSLGLPDDNTRICWCGHERQPGDEHSMCWPGM